MHIKSPDYGGSGEFSSVQGSKELNLDSWMKKMISHDFEQCELRGRMSVDIFDRAQAQVLNMMQKDSFPRFCKSKGLEPPSQDYKISSLALHYVNTFDHQNCLKLAVLVFGEEQQ